MFGVFWVVLGCPLGSPRCSRALLALLGCCWLLLVAPSPPTREPQRATQLLHKSLGSFFRVSEPILGI